MDLRILKELPAVDEILRLRAHPEERAGPALRIRILIGCSLRILKDLAAGAGWEEAAVWVRKRGPVRFINHVSLEVTICQGKYGTGRMWRRRKGLSAQASCLRPPCDCFLNRRANPGAQASIETERTKLGNGAWGRFSRGWENAEAQPAESGSFKRAFSSYRERCVRTALCR